MDKALIIRNIDATAKAEIEKFGTPHIFHYELSNQMGQEVANKLHADTFVVALGTRLMDLKLGEASSKNLRKEHVRMSSDAARELMVGQGLDLLMIEKVCNCIEAHHKDVPFNFLEAEICANADCYRFLTVKGFLAYLLVSGSRKTPFNEAISFGESKFNEKLAILSLQICKDELKQDIDELKRIFSKAKSI